MLLYQQENAGNAYDFRSNFHESGFPVPPHIHEYSELLWVRSGTMTVFLDGIRYAVPERSVLFILPDQIHEYTCQTECSVWCAVFSNDFLTNFYQSYPNRIPQNPVVDFSDGDTLLRTLTALPADAIIARVGTLNLLFAALLRQSDMIDRPASDGSLFRAAIGYIGANYREDVKLTDMARTLGYHEKYLSSKLHALTGMNFRTFLATYRINEAKRLLTATAEKIDRIALECGFGSLNTFNRVFRESVGMTPREYRRHPNG